MSDTVTNEEEMMIQQSESPFGAPSPIISLRNNIYLYDEIDTTITRAFITSLYEMAINMIQESVSNGFDLPEINIHINSNGGSVSDTFAIITAIKNIQNGLITKIGNTPIPIKVNTIAEGTCDSGASLILCVGSHRSISSLCLATLHKVRQVGYGSGITKTNDLQVEAKNLAKWQTLLKKIYLRHSNLTEEQLDKILATEETSTPEELLNYKIVDEIIEVI